MKKVLHFLLKFFSVIVLLIAILFVLSKFLEKKLVELTVTEINNRVSVPIYIDDISFSLIKKFPYATITLKNVQVNSASGFNRNEFNDVSANALFFFSEIYLSVNIMSLFDNKLELKKAYAQHGFINILTDSEGNANYKITNPSPNKLVNDTSQNEFVFMLEQVQFKQVDINMVNNFKKTTLAFSTPVYNLTGSFYKEDYILTTSGNLLINKFETGKLAASTLNKAKVALTLNISNNLLELIEGKISTSQIQLTAKGTVTIDESTFVDLKITGQTTNLDDLATIFQNGTDLSFSTSGKLGVSASVRGILDERNSPGIAVNFKLSDGVFYDKKQQLKITKITLEGAYTNGKKRNTETSTLKIKTFGLTLDDSYLSGNLDIENFNNPNVLLNANLHINLDAVKPWLPSTTETGFGGSLSGNLALEGTLKDPTTFTLTRLFNWKKSGTLNLNQAYYQTDNPKLDIQNTDAVLNINQNQITVSNIRGNVQNTDVTGTLSIADYFSPLTDSVSPWEISAHVETPYVDYDNFKHFFEASTNTTASNPVFITCTFNLQKAKYNVVNARQVKGELTYANNQLLIPKIQFNAYDGLFESRINYLPHGANRYRFQTHTKTTKVDIKKLFTDYNNFNQAFIKDENLAGLLTSDFDLELIFENGIALTSSIELMGHFRIDEGKLTNFQPIIEIAQFSEIDALKNVQFTTLENDLLIANSTINIPKMEITSNAFDMTLYGTQWFNGNYKYHIQLNPTDFMGGKSKRLAKQQTEFGYVEDDGNGDKTLYILATYENGVSKVKLDGDEIKKVIKNDFKEEKIEFKKVLHEEFGWFKNDTTLTQPTKKKKQQEFEIEWDEQ